MNTATTVCAPSRLSWTGIDWPRVQRQVKKLQARIVKATQEGRYGKVKALQWTADPLVQRKKLLL